MRNWREPSRAFRKDVMKTLTKLADLSQHLRAGGWDLRAPHGKTLRAAIDAARSQSLVTAKE